MLSAEENELLCRVGPGRPMGEVFRRYWMPAIRSVELPEPDCPPMRVRLLGEDLVAFRDTSGRVGLLAENCSHRRASLFYGRNEECGLRCIYHGWKYDVEGNILDTPAEPAESMIKHHVTHVAYPCREVNGMVYAYLGPKAEMPLLPDLPWLTLPPEHVRVGRKTINECNWLQTQEGNIDSIHSAFLHASVARSRSALHEIEGRYRNQSNPPAFDIEETRWGVVAAARYAAEEGMSLVRTNVFAMPVYTALSNANYVDGKLDGFTVNVEVPVDDVTTTRYNISVQFSRPFEGAGWLGRDNGEAQPDGTKLFNRANNYRIDRELQRSGVVYSGIDASAPMQDAAMVESMGPMTDRTQEHLGVSDGQVVAVRRFLLAAVKGFQQGKKLPGLAWDSEDDNSYDELCLVSGLVPEDADWKAYAPQLTTRYSL